MKKIPTLFVRDQTNPARVTRELDPGCEWVAAGEGVPTRKWDGTAVRITEDGYWKRYELRPGKTPPPGFEPCDPGTDAAKVPGWVPVTGAPEDKWHLEALPEWSPMPPVGTYELIGPKVNGNPEGAAVHELVAHGRAVLADTDRSHDAIRAFLEANPMEGIVYHHPDGRMAKIKSRDFGIPWPRKENL